MSFLSSREFELSPVPARLCVDEPDVKFSMLRKFSLVNTMELMADSMEMLSVFSETDSCVPLLDGVRTLAGGEPPLVRAKYARH